MTFVRNAWYVAGWSSSFGRDLTPLTVMDEDIVVYCSHVDCLSSVALYRDLVRRGYRNVQRYSGGLLDWEDASLPVEGEFATPP